MSAEDNVNQINAIESVINDFRRMEDTIAGYSLSKYEKAGSQQWAGEKQREFENYYTNANYCFGLVQGQIESAISDCKSQQYNLASQINPLEHPILYVAAWNVALGT